MEEDILDVIGEELDLLDDKEYDIENVYLLNNAIDLEKFKYNKDIAYF